MMRALVALMIWFGAGVVGAQDVHPLSSVHVMQSDDLLSRARDEITGMPHDELSLLMDVLATCGTFSDHELAKHDCDKATNRYRIEYAAGRAVDRVLRARGAVLALLNIEARAPPKTQPTVPAGQMVGRILYVQQTMEEAANARASTLRQCRVLGGRC